MNRLCIETRGIASWRSRLASPDGHWKRYFSAFETAVSWELASRSNCGIPEPIVRLFCASGYGDPVLIIAIAEHKVKLDGGNAASQSDVWAVLKTSSGMLSLTVEAKAKEAFGDFTLERWLVTGKTEAAVVNRKARWNQIRSFLPQSSDFAKVRYQMLHRCAAAVIEADRLGFEQAAFIVQAFESPLESFKDFEVFCEALKIPATKDCISTTTVNGIRLGVGWAHCRFATDADIAAIA